MSTEEDGRKYRVCKRCLISEMLDKAEYFKSLQNYIDNLDSDIKASGELYESRLSTCKQCDLLLEGMCRTCGCYVELRAVIEKNYCPNQKW